MTITLNLPSDIEEAYLAEAQARGLPLNALVSEVLVSHSLPTQSQRPSTPDSWLRLLDDWSASHTGLPALSDEAMSRAAIYADRGL